MTAKEIAFKYKNIKLSFENQNWTVGINLKVGAGAEKLLIFIPNDVLPVLGFTKNKFPQGGASYELKDEMVSDLKIIDTATVEFLWKKEYAV
jgi:hypothetical protein